MGEQPAPHLPLPLLFLSYHLTLVLNLFLYPFSCLSTGHEFVGSGSRPCGVANEKIKTADRDEAAVVVGAEVVMVHNERRMRKKLFVSGRQV